MRVQVNGSMNESTVFLSLHRGQRTRIVTLFDAILLISVRSDTMGCR